VLRRRDLQRQDRGSRYTGYSTRVQQMMSRPGGDQRGARGAAGRGDVSERGEGGEGGVRRRVRGGWRWPFGRLRTGFGGGTGGRWRPCGGGARSSAGRGRRGAGAG